MKVQSAEAGRMNGYEHSVGTHAGNEFSYYSTSCSSTSLGVQKGTIPMTGKKLVYKDEFSRYNDVSVFSAI